MSRHNHRQKQKRRTRGWALKRGWFFGSWSHVVWVDALHALQAAECLMKNGMEGGRVGPNTRTRTSSNSRHENVTSQDDSTNTTGGSNCLDVNLSTQHTRVFDEVVEMWWLFCCCCCLPHSRYTIYSPYILHIEFRI